MPIYFEYLVFITVSMSKLRKPTQCSIICAWRVMAVHWPGVVMTAAENNAADLVCKQGPGQCREYFMSCGCVLNDHNHNQVSFMPHSFSC